METIFSVKYMEKSMAIRKVTTYPADVLRRKAETVTEIDGNIQRLIDDMAETMYNAPGVGLAANQIGELRRVIVVDTAQEEEDSKRDLIALINPEILEAEGKHAIEEGCLSVPYFREKIPRSEKVLVKALDRHGNPIELSAEGIQAIVLQHEIDHLNGVLIIDHVSSLKRSLYKQRLKKMLQEKNNVPKERGRNNFPKQAHRFGSNLFDLKSQKLME
jgi:peptide deformylase